MMSKKARMASSLFRDVMIDQQDSSYNNKSESEMMESKVKRPPKVGAKLVRQTSINQLPAGSTNKMSLSRKRSGKSPSSN